MIKEITKFIKYIITFVKESYIELKKVHWLSRKEAVLSTIVVVILICILAIYVGIIDFILAKIVSLILGGKI